MTDILCFDQWCECACTMYIISLFKPEVVGQAFTKCAKKEGMSLLGYCLS